MPPKTVRLRFVVKARRQFYDGYAAERGQTERRPAPRHSQTVAGRSE
jgi:hypothetical protein